MGCCDPIPLQIHSKLAPRREPIPTTHLYSYSSPYQGFDPSNMIGIETFMNSKMKKQSAFFIIALLFS